MVKKSQKSESQRVTLWKKPKIIKKVKEHHKKKAKDAKNLNPKHNNNKVETDPGIPNAWPFKEQDLKALEARRARAIEELEQKKAARKERAQKRKLDLLKDDGISNLGDSGKGKSSDDDYTIFQKSRDATSKQNEKLYSAEGILNTRMKKAEMKRSKKAKKVIDAMHDGYNSKVDYFKKGSAMDDGGNMSDDDDLEENPIEAKVPMYIRTCDRLDVRNFW